MNIKIQKILSLKKKQEEHRQEDHFMNGQFFDLSGQEPPKHQEQEDDALPGVNLKMQMIYQRYKQRYEFQEQFDQIQMTPSLGLDHDQVVRKLDEAMQMEDTNPEEDKKALLKAITHIKLMRLHKLRDTLKPSPLLVQLYDILELIYGGDKEGALQVDYQSLCNNAYLLDLPHICQVLTTITQDHSRLDDKKVQAMLLVILASLRCARPIQGSPSGLSPGPANEFDEVPRDLCVSPTPRGDFSEEKSVELHGPSQEQGKSLQDYIIFKEQPHKNQAVVKAMLKSGKMTRLETTMRLKTKKPVQPSRYMSGEKSGQKRRRSEVAQEVDNYNSKSVERRPRDGPKTQAYSAQLQQDSQLNLSKIRDIEAYKKKILFNIDRQAKQHEQELSREREKGELEENRQLYKFNEKQKEKEEQAQRQFQKETHNQKANITKLYKSYKSKEKQRYQDLDHQENEQEFQWAQKKERLRKEKERRAKEAKEEEYQAQQRQNRVLGERRVEAKQMEQQQEELRKIKQASLANHHQQLIMDNSYKEVKALLDIYEQNKKINSLTSRKHRL